MSQWTLSLLSLGLIIIPLITVTNIKLQDKYIDFFSISLAVFILTFSLLVGANNYAVRSEKMHQAGLELNELNREMSFIENQTNFRKYYQDFNKRYTDILKRYENVDDIDHKKTEINKIVKNIKSLKIVEIENSELTISHKKRLKHEKSSLNELRREYWFQRFLGILIYLIPILFEFGFILFYMV